jgi:hypothetical protein
MPAPRFTKDIVLSPRAEAPTIARVQGATRGDERHVRGPMVACTSGWPTISASSRRRSPPEGVSLIASTATRASARTRPRQDPHRRRVLARSPEERGAGLYFHVGRMVGAGGDAHAAHLSPARMEHIAPTPSPRTIVEKSSFEERSVCSRARRSRPAREPKDHPAAEYLKYRRFWQAGNRLVRHQPAFLSHTACLLRDRPLRIPERALLAAPKDPLAAP